jgi:DNA-binding MarR family transcriptional regulator
MHAISFQLKRAHLKAVMFGRDVLKKLRKDGELTPARFDILYALRREAIVGGPAFHPLLGVTQAELTRVLGLHPSTVSKMVSRLVEIGWVVREPCHNDRRKKAVRLTPAGLRLVWRIMRRIFRRRSIRRVYADILRRRYPKEEVMDVLTRAFGLLKGIAYAFGDRSSLWYDYGGRVPNNQHYWDDIGLFERRRLKWGIILPGDRPAASVSHAPS